MPPPPPLPPPAVLPPSRVLVAGSTGWLGAAVVRELVSRGYGVVALARDPDSPRARELLSLGGGGGGNGAGTVVVAGGNVTDKGSLERAMRANESDGKKGAPPVSAVVSCVGMRDMAVPDQEIAAVLREGTLALADALWSANNSAAAAADASSSSSPSPSSSSSSNPSPPPQQLLLVAVAGGIHRDRSGRVNREMVHNRMREEALEEIAARRRRAEREQQEHLEERQREEQEKASPRPRRRLPLLPPAVVAIDPSVFFKDSETIFKMIAKSVKVTGEEEEEKGEKRGKAKGTASTTPAATPRRLKKRAKASLSLVRGSWDVRCNPISARDLASRLVDALSEQGDPCGARGGGASSSSSRPPPPSSSPPRPPPSSSSSSPSLVRRFRVGGPQVLSFAELADEAGKALSENDNDNDEGGGGGGGDHVVVEVEHKSIPRFVARALLALASLLSASSRPSLSPSPSPSPLLGSVGNLRKKALAAKRFLSFLWVVGTDESPGSLVGDERCGSDTLSAFYAELGAEEKRRRRSRKVEVEVENEKKE